jgi:glycerol-3-phosphate acyltransferase PlsY
LSADASTISHQPLAIFAGVCAIIGHNWTCFLRFKGGKGVATSLGFLLGIIPLGALAALAVWLAAVLISRYVSLASIVAAAALGVGVWFLYPQPVWLPAVISVLALLAIVKHHANIRRLLNGTENRLSFPKKK